MAPELALSNEDLRDAAKEYKLEQDHKRELDHKHKWALGETDESSGRRRDFRDGYRRPERPTPVLCVIAKAPMPVTLLY